MVKRVKQEIKTELPDPVFDSENTVTPDSNNAVVDTRDFSFRDKDGTIVTRTIKPEEIDATIIHDKDPEPIDDLQQKFDELQKEREVREAKLTQLEEQNKKYQEAQQKLVDLQNQVQTSGINELTSYKAILDQAHQVEYYKVEELKRNLAYAWQTNNYNDAVNYQEQLADSKALMKQMQSEYYYYDDLEKKQKQQPALQNYQIQSADPFEDFIVTNNIDVRLANWAREHKEDILQPHRANLLDAADRMAQAKGYTRGSDPYLDFLDEQMAYNQAGSQADPVKTVPATHVKQTTASSTVSKRVNYSAPPSRISSQNGSGSKFELDPNQKFQAQALGMSDEQFAPYIKLAEQKLKNRMNRQ